MAQEVGILGQLQVTMHRALLPAAGIDLSITNADGWAGFHAPPTTPAWTPAWTSPAAINAQTLAFRELLPTVATLRVELRNANMSHNNIAVTGVDAYRVTINPVSNSLFFIDIAPPAGVNWSPADVVNFMATTDLGLTFRNINVTANNARIGGTWHLPGANMNFAGVTTNAAGEPANVADNSFDRIHGYGMGDNRSLLQISSFVTTALPDRPTTAQAAFTMSLPADFETMTRTDSFEMPAVTINEADGRFGSFHSLMGLGTSATVGRDRFRVRFTAPAGYVWVTSGLEIDGRAVASDVVNVGTALAPVLVPNTLSPVAPISPEAGGELWGYHRVADNILDVWFIPRNSATDAGGALLAPNFAEISGLVLHADTAPLTGNVNVTVGWGYTAVSESAVTGLWAPAGSVSFRGTETNLIGHRAPATVSLSLEDNAEMPVLFTGSRNENVWTPWIELSQMVGGAWDAGAVRRGTLNLNVPAGVQITGIQFEQYFGDLEHGLIDASGDRQQGGMRLLGADELNPTHDVLMYVAPSMATIMLPRGEHNVGQTIRVRLELSVSSGFTGNFIDVTASGTAVGTLPAGAAARTVTVATVESLVNINRVGAVATAAFGTGVEDLFATVRQIPNITITETQAGALGVGDIIKVYLPGSRGVLPEATLVGTQAMVLPGSGLMLGVPTTEFNPVTNERYVAFPVLASSTTAPATITLMNMGIQGMVMMNQTYSVAVTISNPTNNISNDIFAAQVAPGWADQIRLAGRDGYFASPAFSLPVLTVGGAGGIPPQVPPTNGGQQPGAPAFTISPNVMHPVVGAPTRTIGGVTHISLRVFGEQLAAQSGLTFDDVASFSVNPDGTTTFTLLGNNRAGVSTTLFATTGQSSVTVNSGGNFFNVNIAPIVMVDGSNFIAANSLSTVWGYSFSIENGILVFR
jgi:hypothetical protein